MRITRPADGLPVPLDGVDLSDTRLYSSGDAHALWRVLRAEHPLFRQERDSGEPFWAVTLWGS